jgi:hypothetical protein
MTFTRMDQWYELSDWGPARWNGTLSGAGKCVNLSAEIAFASMLPRHGLRVFDHLTTTEQRCERARAGILEAGIGDRIAGRRNGKRATFAQCFARLYGQPLDISAQSEAA